jgi:hypothetical protein
MVRASDRSDRYDPFGHLYRRPPSITSSVASPSHIPRTAAQPALLASFAPTPNTHHPRLLPLRPRLRCPHVLPLPCRPLSCHDRPPLVPSLTFAHRLLLDARTSSKDLEGLMAGVETLETPSRTMTGCLIRTRATATRWMRS